MLFYFLSLYLLSWLMYAYVLNHAYHLFLIPKSSSIALTILVVTSDLAKQKNKSFIWQTHMVSMDIIDVEPYIVRVFFVCVESSYTTCLLNPQKHWTLSFGGGDYSSTTTIHCCKILSIKYVWNMYSKYSNFLKKYVFYR